MKTQPYLLALWLVAGGMGLFKAEAQSSVQAAGGLATGPGGTASYAVGLVAHRSATGPGGTVTPGPHQPFEIFVLATKFPRLIGMECTSYPNPTADGVTLQIDDKLARNLTWRLTDLAGRELLTQRVVGPLTPISLAAFPAGAYLLAVISQAQEIKAFKIIKQ